MIDLLVAAIDQRSSQGIAAAIGRLVSSGAVAEGDRLPTVRALSAALGVSPTTVSEAWRTLAAVGAIEPRGRLGTFVGRRPGPGSGQRYRRVTEGPGHFDLDLSTGTPDVELLPDLRPIVADVGRQSLTSTYLDRPVLPGLWDHLAASWPFPAEDITVVDGAMDAFDRIAREVVRLGDRVVVEDPTFPPVLDLLDQLGAEVIGVPLDAEGISTAGLEAALAHRPSMVFLQPRAQNPTGITMSARRARAVARAIAATDAIVVEDDHSAAIASGELVSIGTWIPERTVHVRGFSKSHGPDLRLAAVGGAASVIDAITSRRLLGPGWSSRILQSVLLALLTDPSTIWQVEAARHEYAVRRRTFSRALVEHGLEVTGTDGINVWVAVADERSALVQLAAQGIGVAPGDPFAVRRGGDHLRITIGLFDGSEAEIRALARQVADAAGARVGPPPARVTRPR